MTGVAAWWYRHGWTLSQLPRWMRKHWWLSLRAGTVCWVWPDYAARIQGCSQDQQWQDQVQVQDCSSQDQDQDQNARTSGEHRLIRLSSSLSSSCLSQKLLNKISSSLCLCQNYLINFHHHRPHRVCNVFIYISARKNTFNSFIQETYRINTIVLFSEVETRPSQCCLPTPCVLSARTASYTQCH